MSRFVQEPDKPKAVDPMALEIRQMVGRIQVGNNVAQDILSRLGEVDNKEIAAAIDRLAESMSKLAEALKAMAPQEVKLAKSFTAKKSGNQEWKVTVDR